MSEPQSESRSAAWRRRARQVLPDGNSRSTIGAGARPVYAAKAAGAEIVDVDGNRLVDFNNNMTSLIHGSAYPPVVAAVGAQAARGTAFAMATGVEVEFAELLCGRVASFDKVRFVNSGSEAVMQVVKAARGFTGRPKIAKVEGCYHGSYDFAEVSLSNGPNDRDADGPLATAYCFGTPRSVLDEVVVLPFNDAAGAGRLIERHADELACVLIDPLPLALGMATFDAEYLDALARLTRRHGVLLCLDEVVSFRAGHGGAQEALGIEPDLTALGKIIGGGFPVGAVAGRAEAMAVFESGGDAPARVHHGGTFNANPVTMTAGLAAMADMDEARFAALNAAGEELRGRLRTLLAEAGVAGQVAGVGSLFALHFHERPMRSLDAIWPTTESERRRTRFLRDFLRESGMWMLQAGIAGCLSTATTAIHVDALCEAVQRGLADRRFRDIMD